MDNTDLEEWAVEIINNAAAYKRTVYYFILIILISIFVMITNYYYGAQNIWIDVASMFVILSAFFGILDIKTCEYVARKVLDK